MQGRLAVKATAAHSEVIEFMATKTADVLLMSRKGGNNGPELIDSAELAARWKVPESWIRNRTRARTPNGSEFRAFAWGDCPF